MLFRLLVISLFLGGTILYRMRSPEAPTPIVSALLALVALSYGQALLSAIFLRYLRPSHVMVQVQICWDLLFCTVIVYLTGASHSLFSFLYILTIIYSAFLCSRYELLVISSAAAILYGSLLDLQYYGLLPELSATSLWPAVQGEQIFYQVCITVSAFFLTGLLGGALAQRLRVSEAALRTRESDVQELARLNELILENISSGLMLIDSRGRIQTLNAAATQLTGYAPGEVTRRHYQEVFPDLTIDFSRSEAVRREEMAFSDKAGRERIIGFGYSPLEDSRRRQEGVLLTFQDLTEYKDLEERYERTKRLAVVGRFASGMAHEIRNPLASISGSVQLLQSLPSLQEHDRRLMAIVVREADRLSRLLGEFLDYARPPKPKKKTVQIAPFLDEILDLLSSDPRSKQISIHRDYSSTGSLEIDPDQIRQVIWNLGINAIEAMEHRGALFVGLDLDSASIYIEDTGPGVPRTIRDKIFDPFFTTKEQGTGLGLAMVYSSMQAHGGNVLLMEGARGGSRFVLQF